MMGVVRRRASRFSDLVQYVEGIIVWVCDFVCAYRSSTLRPHR